MKVEEQLVQALSSISNRFNFSKRMMQNALITGSKTAVRKLPKITTVETANKVNEWLAKFVKDYAEPFNELYERHPQTTWKLRFLDSVTKRLPECQKLIALKKKMLAAWKERPEELKSATKATGNFKKIKGGTGKETKVSKS